MSNVKLSNYSIQSPLSTYMNENSVGSCRSTSRPSSYSCFCLSDMRYCFCFLFALLLLGFAMSMAYNAGQRGGMSQRSVRGNLSTSEAEIETDGDAETKDNDDIDELERFKRQATEVESALKPLKEKVGWDDEQQTRHRRKSIDELLASFQMDSNDDEDDDNYFDDDDESFKKKKCRKGGRCHEPKNEEWLYNGEDDKKLFQPKTSIHEQLNDDANAVNAALNDMDFGIGSKTYAVKQPYTEGMMYQAYQRIQDKQNQKIPRVESLYFPGEELSGGRMQIPNDLSHEADYKLSKIEQELAEKRVNMTKFPYGYYSFYKKKRAFNPMAEIKLKTSARLMRLGMGPQLPSQIQASMSATPNEIPYNFPPLLQQDVVPNLKEYPKTENHQFTFNDEYNYDPRTYAAKTTDTNTNRDYYYKPYGEMNDVVNRGQYGLPLWKPRYKRISDANAYEEYQKELNTDTGTGESDEDNSRPKRTLSGDGSMKKVNSLTDPSINAAKDDENVLSNVDLVLDKKDDSQDLIKRAGEKSEESNVERVPGEVEVVVVGREEDTVNRFDEGMNLDSESEGHVQHGGRQRRCVMIENRDIMGEDDGLITQFTDDDYIRYNNDNNDAVRDYPYETSNNKRFKKKHGYQNEGQRGQCRCMFQQRGRQKMRNDEYDYYDNQEFNHKIEKPAYYGTQLKKQHKIVNNDGELRKSGIQLKKQHKIANNDGELRKSGIQLKKQHKIAKDDAELRKSGTQLKKQHKIAKDDAELKKSGTQLKKTYKIANECEKLKNPTQLKNPNKIANECEKLKNPTQLKKPNTITKTDEELRKTGTQLKKPNNVELKKCANNENDNVCKQYRKFGAYRNLLNGKSKMDMKMVDINGMKVPEKILEDFAFIYEDEAEKPPRPKHRFKYITHRNRKKRSLEDSNEAHNASTTKSIAIIQDIASIEESKPMKTVTSNVTNNFISSTSFAERNNDTSEQKHVIKREVEDNAAYDLENDAFANFELRHKVDEEDDEEFKSPPFASNYDKLVEKLSQYSTDRNGFKFDDSSKISQILHSPKTLWQCIEKSLEEEPEIDDDTDKGNTAMVDGAVDGTVDANEQPSKQLEEKPAQQPAAQAVIMKTGGSAVNVKEITTGTNQKKLTSSTYVDGNNFQAQENESPSQSLKETVDKVQPVGLDTFEDRERRDLDSRSERGCKTKAKEVEGCDQIETPLEKLMSGKLSKQIVNNIFKVVRENPKLSMLWTSLQHNRPISRQALKTFYAIRAKDNNAEMRRTEQMIQRAMQSINDIASESSKSPAQDTCPQPLRPDLQEFYDMIMENYASQEKVRQKREGAFDIADEFYNEVSAIDANVIDEKSRIVKKLLREYEELSPEHQEEMSNVHDELQKDLKFLHKLRESKDILLERRKREVEEWEASEFVSKEGDAELIKRMQAEISPEYLKLVKTAEIFKDAGHDETPFVKEKYQPKI